jgi:hypothetical protein|eukprot:COSAG06_NODE_1546_length_9134_cov_2.183951_7_plen_92_part_00
MGTMLHEVLGWRSLACVHIFLLPRTVVSYDMYTAARAAHTYIQSRAGVAGTLARRGEWRYRNNEHYVMHARQDMTLHLASGIPSTWARLSP